MLKEKRLLFLSRFRIYKQIDRMAWSVIMNYAFLNWK